AVTKGEWLKAAKCREVFPLSRLTPTAPPQAVAPFGVLYKPLAKTRGRFSVPSSSQSLTLARRKADFTWRSHISHCAGNISLRFGAISLRS
ncbi:MAG: hypothetical protein SOV19_04900, partial [Eubacteriales bacterium]|nr:hypothetical protein [Christensenellaceae bacterium]MDY2748010.1 hypothetical protein [Eubacteriales bacterium]